MTKIKTSRRHAVAAVLALAVIAGLAQAQTGPQPKLETVRLNAGMHNIVAELARTPDERAVGMMFRREMAAHEGMLFVFSAAGPQCFWMRNTLLPLSIAFIDDDGTIVNMADMQPQSTQSHCSKQPVRFALEMNQGWFERRGIKPGFRLSGPPFQR